MTWHPDNEKCQKHGAVWAWPKARYRCGCAIPAGRWRTLLKQLKTWMPTE